jgi:uncharacterized RDD family membrane protein YckC
MFWVMLIAFGAVVAGGVAMLSQSESKMRVSAAIADAGADAPAAQLVIAPPWRRFLARLIDNVILGIVVRVFVGAALVGDLRELGQLTRESVEHASVVGLIAAGVIACVYEVSLVAFTGRTIGKLALGIKVVRADDGAMPSLGTALMRWLISILAVAVAASPIGVKATSASTRVLLLLLAEIAVFGPILWDRARQGAHDKAAKTLVVMA